MGDAPGLREYRGAVAFDLKRLVADRFGENYALHEQYVNPTLVDVFRTIGFDLDHTLASRDTTNAQLRAALDSATQQWGVKVMRIELKNITPPEEIRLTMEKQMTAERNRRAVVTAAEGEKSSSILRAEGQKQSQIVNAEGSKQAAILAAEGQAEARLRIAQAEAQAIELIAKSLGGTDNPAQYGVTTLGQHVTDKIAGGRNFAVPDVQQTLGSRSTSEI